MGTVREVLENSEALGSHKSALVTVGGVRIAVRAQGTCSMKRSSVHHTAQIKAVAHQEKPQE